MTDPLDHVTPMPTIIEPDRNSNRTWPPEQPHRRRFVYDHAQADHMFENVTPVHLPDHLVGVEPGPTPRRVDRRAGVARWPSTLPSRHHNHDSLAIHNDYAHDDEPHRREVLRAWVEDDHAGRATNPIHLPVRHDGVIP